MGVDLNIDTKRHTLKRDRSVLSKFIENLDATSNIIVCLVWSFNNLEDHFHSGQNIHTSSENYDKSGCRHALDFFQSSHTTLI